MSKVTSNFFRGLFINVWAYLNALYSQCNTSANILAALEEQNKTKSDRIESALKGIEQEIDDWEEYLFSTPTASTVITRNYGTAGLRPIIDTNGNLELLSTVVQANVDVTYSGGVATAIVSDTIQEPFFSEEAGLQVRFTYTYSPGMVDKIRLEPLSSAGTISINQMRVYNSAGAIVSTITSAEDLPRTLEYSIPKTVVARIEVDLIDSTFNIIETSSTQVKTGSKRIVIPATKIQEEYQVDVVTPNPTQPYYGGWVPRPRRRYLTYIASLYRDVLKDMFDNYADMYPTGYIADEQDWCRGNPQNTTTTKETRYRWVDVPEQILMEPYEYTETTYTKSYEYSCGLGNVVCSHNYYTEVMQHVEEVRFENGIPGYVSLTTDEFLPTGSYINFYLMCKDGQIIPLVPNNREYTTDVLMFNSLGKATLNFYPVGPIYFYKDEAIPISLQVNSKTVLGPLSNTGAFNIASGTTYWAKYEADQTKSNIISYTGRVASYVSKDGKLGEVFDRIPEEAIIELQETPYIDQTRLSDTSYSPVQVVVDGYQTIDYTNYNENEEDEFPVSEQWESGVQKIHYKVRGKSIFFEKSVDRPVRIMYEFSTQYAKLIIETGVIYETAASPVLYQWQMSYI